MGALALSAMVEVFLKGARYLFSFFFLERRVRGEKKRGEKKTDFDRFAQLSLLHFSSLPCNAAFFLRVLLLPRPLARVVPSSLFLRARLSKKKKHHAPRTEEALEALECAQALDAWQAGRHLRK